jgi:ABC-2 type transport system permease protein
MHSLSTLTAASLKMFLRNRQALFFSLFMPLLILFIFGSIDFGRDAPVHIGIALHNPSPATTAMIDHVKSAKSLAVSTGTLDAELAALREGSRAAVIDLPDNPLAPTTAPATAPAIQVYVNAGRPIESATALAVLNQFADKAALAAAGAKPLFTFSTQDVSARNFRYIDFLLPGIMAMAIMQMSVFSVAFVFARYKEQGILKRLMATPLRPSQFVTANILTRLLMSVAQAAIFLAVGVGWFHVHVFGSWPLLAAAIVLGALMFLGLGFTISGLSKTTETVPVLSNILVFPMLFIGNVFFSISNMAPWLQAIAKFLPLTYFASALRAIINGDAAAGELQRDFVGMAVWAVVLVTLATITFRIQDKEAL